MYVLEGSACRQHKCDVATAERKRNGKRKQNGTGKESTDKSNDQKIKNKVWLFLKKIYTKLPEKMKVHIRKLKPKEKIRGEYKGSDQAEEMPVLKVSPNRGWIRLFWIYLQSALS